MRLLYCPLDRSWHIQGCAVFHGQACDCDDGGEPPDPINRPVHYTGRVEPIHLIEAQGLGYHEGNVIKYVVRYKRKGGLTDLKKARWYLDRLIKSYQDNQQEENANDTTADPERPNARPSTRTDGAPSTVPRCGGQTPSQSGQVSDR